VDELLGVLRTAVGESGTSSPDAAAPPPPSPGGSAERPAALEALDDAHTVLLDVRDAIRHGEEPFARIMAAVRTLAADQVLAVRVPFEPFPLYDVLGRRGLAHWTERRAADDWVVWFYRDGSTPSEPRREERPEAAAAPTRTAVLDVRGLEPPHPMVRVLEALDRLAPGDVLEVHHERRPMFLYPQLDARGFVHDTDEPEPGFVRIRIRRGRPS
jgi:uncharacterized protein (DUF2249 family)